ncbi:DUF7288 family protein [Methanolobus halotolerans]|uniref:Uncharacterized protein n=1 Tax=Methanolobus halotolerans TaxID=2052935 RepID=A0A4E0Q2X8_9EURY|nr:hypothetical protein [Methanolobus halotolerans]TGC07296.1 hypothetical protein CUN85_11625 [Methanolobus halotolerans]
MHTLEAIMAAMIMFAIIVFTVQATSLTPLTSSTANAHIEAQLQTMGQDMLNALSYSAYGNDSDLKTDILNWDGEQYVWNGTAYRTVRSPTYELQSSSLARTLEFIAVRRGIAHNVHFSWVNEEGIAVSHRYIYNGDPSNNAVMISKKVQLSDADVDKTTGFEAQTGVPDASNETDFYNIINVKMTLWRM